MRCLNLPTRYGPNTILLAVIFRLKVSCEFSLIMKGAPWFCFMGPVPLPMAHLLNALQVFCFPSLNLKGTDTFFFKPCNNIQGKKRKIKKKEMREHTFPKSCVKITYIKIIILQKIWRLWFCPCCHQVNSPLEQNYAMKCLEPILLFYQFWDTIYFRQVNSYFWPYLVNTYGHWWWNLTDFFH